MTLLLEDSKKVRLCFILKDMVVSALVFRLGGCLPQDPDPVKQEVNFDVYPDASKERMNPQKRTRHGSGFLHEYWAMVAVVRRVIG